MVIVRHRLAGRLGREGSPKSARAQVNRNTGNREKVNTCHLR